MTNRHLIILDGNHLAYRALYKFSNLRTLDGVKTGVIFGMPYVAESLIRRLGPTDVVIAFDGGRSKFRMDLLPTYKEREKKLGFDAEDFFRQKDVGRDIFMSLGIKIVWKRHFEADDLIYMVARRYASKGYDVTIVSGDKDFNQLLDDKIKIYNVGKGITYEAWNLKKELGYTPGQCVDYLSLCGDKSDNIPGYPGIGPKRAMDMLERFGSIREFLRSKESFGKLDKEELARIHRLNKKLIDIKFFYRKFLIKEAIPWLNPGKLDLKKFKQYCNEYEMGSFLKPQFINTFKKLNHE